MVSRREWMNRHVKDPYVKQAQVDGYRSRAVYKLLEINEKERLFRPGIGVVDLGAAPGSWAEWARKQVGRKGFVIALDCLAMDPIPDVEFIQGDFREESVLNKLHDSIGGRSVDLVISDMAPNMSGQKSIDQPRSIYLAELAYDLAVNVLVPGGSLLMKVFQGAGIEALAQSLRSHFKQVKHIKPKASRLASKEVYLLAKSFYA